MGRMLISDETISLGTSRDANSRLCRTLISLYACSIKVIMFSEFSSACRDEILIVLYLR